MSKNLTPEERAKPPTRRVADPELQAMSKIGEMLNALDADGQERVLEYLTSRYAKPADPMRSTTEGD